MVYDTNESFKKNAPIYMYNCKLIRLFVDMLKNHFGIDTYICFVT